MDHTVFVSHQGIEALRLLMAIGLLGSVLLLALLWRDGKPETPAHHSIAPATCKLHQRPEEQCRDMHDPDA